jgi:spore photoproduct lyase
MDEILAAAKKYIEERAPEITRFEAACTSDPVSLEPLTGNLKRVIEFMGKEELGRLRFVTKYDTVDSLLDADHRGHTRFRFSVNADYVIKHFEPATSSFYERIVAAGKVARAGYPLGFIVAPIIRFDGWQEGYRDLMKKLAQELDDKAKANLTFELIQHRFTKTAKNVILKRYPKTRLEMNEEERKYKWGRYGRGKYVYRDEEAEEIQEVFHRLLGEYFPEATLEYFT